MNIWVISILVFILVTFVLALFVFVKRAFTKKLNEADLAYVRAHWTDVVNNAEENPVKSLLDADKILDYVLTRHGFGGSLGEKLKAAGPRFSDLNGLWNAHKLRNRMAHELVEIDSAEVEYALKQFKRGLKDLGVKF